MAHVGVAITKQTAFRDSVQEFTNIYHYQWTGLNPGQSLAEVLIDRLVTLEKTWHANTVQFLRGQCWSAGGTPAQNAMIAQKTLTGNGACATISGLDKERAFLIQWNAGISSNNKPVKLRKWFHTCGAFGSYSPPVGALDNSTQIPQAGRDIIKGLTDALNPLVFDTGAISARLVSPNGDREGDTVAVPHKYLEHHQLGEMWR